MARILIAVDGSTHSQHALDFGASLAARLKLGVTLLHAMPQVVLPLGGAPQTLAELQESIQEEGTQLLKQMEEKARAHPVSVTTELAVGDPAQVISDRSEAPDIEMVVVGSRGQGAVARLLLGSVATKVVHLCTRPVVVVR
jgi:nucleotide-binding universal stress UspA family protein